MKVVKIEGWGIVDGCLVGTVTGHPTIPDGARVLTSEIDYIRPTLKVAITQNTVYELGTQAGADEVK